MYLILYVKDFPNYISIKRFCWLTNGKAKRQHETEMQKVQNENDIKIEKIKKNFKTIKSKFTKISISTS